MCYSQNILVIGHPTKHLIYPLGICFIFNWAHHIMPPDKPLKLVTKFNFHKRKLRIIYITILHFPLLPCFQNLPLSRLQDLLLHCKMSGKEITYYCAFYPSQYLQQCPELHNFLITVCHMNLYIKLPANLLQLLLSSTISIWHTSI